MVVVALLFGVLLVTPIGGAGAPYQAVVKTAVPRLYIPMVLPGARIGVLIDPTDPSKVSADFSRMGQMGQPSMAAATPPPPGGFNMDFDANGQPAAGEVAAVASGVRSGQVNTIKGSADELLASGTRGTAVITTAMPLGQTVRDINPAADPSRLNDPVWLFTVECEVPGQGKFPSVFGHRVPLAKLSAVAPGVKLVVAVNMANKNQEVAIDWDASPVA